MYKPVNHAQGRGDKLCQGYRGLQPRSRRRASHSSKWPLPVRCAGRHRGSKLLLSHQGFGSCQCSFCKGRRSRVAGQGARGRLQLLEPTMASAGPGAEHFARGWRVRRKKRCSDCLSEALATAMFACLFFHQMLLRLHIHFCCLLWLSQAALSCHKAFFSPITDQTDPLLHQFLPMMPSS